MPHELTDFEKMVKLEFKEIKSLMRSDYITRVCNSLGITLSQIKQTTFPTNRELFPFLMAPPSYFTSSYCKNFGEYFVRENIRDIRYVMGHYDKLWHNDSSAILSFDLKDEQAIGKHIIRLNNLTAFL